MSEVFARFAAVALPVLVPRVFHYGVSERPLRARPGARVRVRFGSSVLVGCITEIVAEPPSIPERTTLLPLTALLDDEPVLTEGQLSLGRFLADYYLAPPGIVYRAMLPPETPRAQRERFKKTTAGESASASGLADEVLAVLAGPMTPSAVAKAVARKSVSGTIASLLRDGLVERVRARETRGFRKLRVASLTEAGRLALDEEKLHPTTSRILTLLSVATDPVPLTTVRRPGTVSSPAACRPSLS